MKLYGLFTGMLYISQDMFTLYDSYIYICILLYIYIYKQTNII